MPESGKSGDGGNGQQNWRPVWEWINTSGFKMLLAVGAILIVVVVSLAFSTIDLSVRATILAAGIPAVLTFVVVVIQAAVSKQMAEIMERQEAEMRDQRIAAQEQAQISSKQWRVMEDQLAVMHRQEQLLESRIHVIGVMADNFDVEKKPLFMVGLQNLGATDAESVVIFLRTESSPGRLFQWSREQVVTIPANAKKWFPVRYDHPLTKKTFSDLHEGRETLTVSGYYQYGSSERKEICFKYYPWQGERPEGLEHFFPCDFDPGVARWLVAESTGPTTVTLNWGGEDEWDTDEPDENQ